MSFIFVQKERFRESENTYKLLELIQDVIKWTGYPPLQVLNEVGMISLLRGNEKNMKKKPDQVVYNEEKGKYDAALTPYATNLGAPTIVTEDVTTWENSNISKVNHQFQTEYEELKEKYEKMMEKFEYNNLIYSAKFSFEPIVGAIYHLYRSKGREPFLSLISPEECNWDFAGTFELKADKIWNRLDTTEQETEINEE